MDRIYLVDWGIPMQRRRMFYYNLNKIKVKYELVGSMSTQSVFIVADLELAREVHVLASRYGLSHFYRCEEITANM